MWLLRTSTAELVHFVSPNDVKGGYAILSHVWQDHEMSFQELQALRLQPGTSHDTQRSRASAKIRECCILAESHGYEWLWIDTCCIDRTSSAELSEAINSMYAWYTHASVCYAYLYDVPTIGSLQRRDSPFRRSKWFTRSWTLQELIAPKCLMFLSQDWQMLGTKASLAALLEQISGVDADVLAFRRHVTDVSVARRMWWASNRRATRLEDEAYSLMGLFGVHMPTIYGEGARSFGRLQEEILKRTSDQTLFAWGNVLPINATPFRERLSYSNYHEDSHLFAPSVAAFRNSAHMVSVPVPVAMNHAITTLGIPPARLEASAGKASAHSSREPYSIAFPDFMMTSHGTRSRMLVVESSSGSSVLAVAVLACRDESTGSYVGLLLRRARRKAMKNPRYHVGTTICGAIPWMRLRYRLAQVDWAAHLLSFGESAITAEVKQLYISHRPSSRKARPRKHTAAAFRFYFPRWLEVELRKRGIEPDRPLPVRPNDAYKLSDAGPHASFLFSHKESGEAIRLQVGQCGGSPWAHAQMNAEAEVGTKSRPVTSHSDDVTEQHPPGAQSELIKSTFDCHKSHVTSWLNGAKTFGDKNKRVQLTFTRVNEGETHMLDVRFGGRAFQAKVNVLEQTSRRAIHTMSRSLVRLLLP